MDESGFKPSGHTIRKFPSSWFTDLKEVGVERIDGVVHYYNRFHNKPVEIPITEFDMAFGNVES